MASTRKSASRLLLLERPSKNFCRRRSEKRAKALKQASFGLITDSRLAAQKKGRWRIAVSPKESSLALDERFETIQEFALEENFETKFINLRALSSNDYVIRATAIEGSVTVSF
jgi:hypothetical protein